MADEHREPTKMPAAWRGQVPNLAGARLLNEYPVEQAPVEALIGGAQELFGPGSALVINLLIADEALKAASLRCVMALKERGVSTLRKLPARAQPPQPPNRDNGDQP